VNGPGRTEDAVAARVLAVNVGRARAVAYGSSPYRTAIDKRPVDGPVPLDELGLLADEQADRAGHGGVDQAVYAYAAEDAAFWAAELDREVRPGAFGENLTLSGVDVTGAVVGERWRVGGVEFQVTSPRIPCRTFSDFWGVPDLVKRFTTAGRPGAYLSVVAAGAIEAGTSIEVVSRPAHGVSIGDLARYRAGERDGFDRLLGAVPWLPSHWVEWVRKIAAVKPSA
jgi:MOSC domain-containing protein YiiM